MRYLIGSLFLLASLILSGCGTTYSLQRFTPVDGQPSSAFIDIKQRAVLTGKRPASGSPSGVEVVMCAEPSPDAISSFASELAADAKYKDMLQASLSLSEQEAASFVGLRTQTIQLLRDGMYRLCEGYMSGALTGPDYAWLSRRYQKYMVALLTIEQLTRVAQAPTVALASQGMASASRSAAAIQQDLKEIDKNISQLNKDKTDLDAKKAEIDKRPDSDTAKKGDLDDVQKNLKANEEALTQAKEIRAAMLEGLGTAKGLLTSGSTTVQVISGTQEGRSSTSDAVATAIKEITKLVVDQDDLPTLCFQLLDGSRAGLTADPALKTACANLVTARATFETNRANKAVDTSSSDGLPSVGLMDLSGTHFLALRRDSLNAEQKQALEALDRSIAKVTKEKKKAQKSQ